MGVDGGGGGGGCMGRGWVGGVGSVALTCLFSFLQAVSNASCCSNADAFTDAEASQFAEDYARVMAVGEGN